MYLNEDSTWIVSNNKSYTFKDYSIDHVFDDKLVGNYIFAKRYNNRLKAIYIGEGEIKNRVSYRINDGCVIRKGADVICVMENYNESSRKQIESDLLATNIDSYSPTGCNIKFGG